jgi:hypothetical protein
MKEKSETASLAFLVQNLEEAIAIRKAAGERSHARALLLVSTPSTAAKEGALWFLSLIEEAGWPKESRDVLPVLDCGEHPGYVLEALELAPLGIIFSGPTPIAEKLSAIAEAKGCTFYCKRPELIELPLDPGARAEHLRALKLD